MKLIFISKLGQTLIKDDCKHIPRIGEKVDMFYEPKPNVSQVVNFPSEETLKSAGILNVHNIDAIVILD